MAKYVDSQLVDGEVVTFRTSLHPIIFFWPVFLAVASVPLFFLPETRATGSFLLALAVIIGLGAWIRFASSEFAVTDRRVIIKVGLIRRNTLETLLEKVEGVGVDQGIGGRILGYGTITVTGTGGTKEQFNRINDPLDFRRNVQEGSTASHARAAQVHLQAMQGQPALAQSPREERECPHCAELILTKAKICKHCGKEVDPVG